MASGAVETPDEPTLTFYGSGDFHHVSLALVRRRRAPFNLLVLDNHPDWMRGVPFLHCGTWLYHAARLPQVRRIFHVGGDVDFDNVYRWLAPWPLLHAGKIVTLKNLEFRLGDLERPPIDPRSVDLVVLSQALHHAANPDRAIAAAYELLRPGGQIMILDLLQHTFEKARELYGDRWLGFTENDLHRWLEAAGFRKLEISVVAREEQPPNFQTILAAGEK